MKIYTVITFFLAIIMLFFPFLSLNENLADFSFIREKEDRGETVLLQNSSDGTVTESELFDYIVGSVAAEMPALYETEALKAQAVACYTYQKYLRENGNKFVSDSSQIHQAHMTEEELRAFWGDKYDSYIEKIRSAVESVYGEYLSCDGKTVPTLYHALSPGMTQSSKTVFGNEVKSLQSVTAPGDKLSPDYISEKVFSEDEIRSLLQKKNLTLSDNPESWIKIEDCNESGYVNHIVIGSRDFDGNDAREIFSLLSPCFTIEYENDKFVFTVYGKGHGVGMSQYSADYMARQGSSYDEILLHFYKDAEISK